VPEKFRKRFISQVRRFNREELEERLADVLRLDIAIKTSRADPKVLLEAAVVRLCL
jgi:DNA polymerase III delta subunit